MAHVIERDVVHEPVNHTGSHTALIAVLIIAFVIVLLYLLGGGSRFFSGFGGTPAISVPRQVDVNVNSGGAPAPQAPAQ